MKDRILIIRLSALGDILHGLPVLAALRGALPEAKIGWLIEDRAEAILRGHPMLDALHVLPRKAWKQNPFTALAGPLRALHTELREADYQTAIDLQGLTKSAFWAKMCGAPNRIGFQGEEAREVSRLFYSIRVHPRADQYHVIQRNLALLRPLGIDRGQVEFPIHIAAEDRGWADRAWGSSDETHPRVIMNPGAGWPSKEWPAANYGRLAMDLAIGIGARVALAWGPGEEGLVREALDAAGRREIAVGADHTEPVGREPGVYALPPSTFTRLGAAIARAHLFVGGDTGPTHYAAALGVPVVALFGASDRHRNGPWGDHCKTFQLTAPACIPCWETRCTLEEEPLACLKNIDAERVKKACLGALGE